MYIYITGEKKGVGLMASHGRISVRWRVFSSATHTAAGAGK